MKFKYLISTFIFIFISNLIFLGCKNIFTHSEYSNIGSGFDNDDPISKLILESGAYKTPKGFEESCLFYLNHPFYNNEGSGLYWVDPMGGGEVTKFKVYCDMSFDGGGWTLILRSNVDDQAFEFNSAIWESAVTFNEEEFDLFGANSSLYASYDTVMGQEVRVDFESLGDIEMKFNDSKTAKSFATAETIFYENNTGGKSEECKWGSVSPIFDSSWALQAATVAMGTSLGRAYNAKVRFGIVAENNFVAYPKSRWDSAIGIGMDSERGNKSSGNGNWPHHRACRKVYGDSNTFVFDKANLWVR